MSTIRKNLTLDLNFDSELEFTLIGISSPLRDYRLCHFLQKQTGLTFIRGKEAYIDHKGYAKVKERDEMDYHILHERNKFQEITTQYFTVYRYNDEHFEFEFYFINNKSLAGSLLVPELGNFDYFIIIKHYMDKEDIDTLIENIKTINEVILVKRLNPSNLKSKENLIF